MGVQIPPILVLIVCKTISAGGPDDNAAFTASCRIEVSPLPRSHRTSTPAGLLNICFSDSSGISI